MNSSHSKEYCCFAGLTPTSEEEDQPALSTMNVIKILAIVVVTSVVTLLCIRSGQAMTKTPGTVYNKTGDNPELRGRGKLSSVSVTSDTVTPKVTVDLVEVRKIVQVVTPEPNRGDDSSKNENQTSTTSTTITAEPLQLATSRSIGDNHVKLLGPLVSGRRASPIVVRGKLLGQIPHPSNHRGSNGVAIVEDDDDNDDNEANIIVDADVYHLNNRYEIYSKCYL